MLVAKKRSRWAEFFVIDLHPDNGVELFRQIYLALRAAIGSQTLTPGSALPSTRQLAKRLDVSRTTVLSAYELLIAEGYIESYSGAGTYVSHDVPQPIDPVSAAGVPRRAAGRVLSHAGAQYRKINRSLAASETVPFRTGCCSVDARTIEAWRRIGIRQMRSMDPVNLHYSNPAGELELRTQVTEYLRAARAVRCEPEQVVIVSGAQQAIDISIRTLLNHGDSAWVEDPGYFGVHAAVTAAGFNAVPVGVDAGGLVVGAGMAAAPDAKVAYVTPSHQFPTGSVMSMSRRLELLAWADARDGWIIEDDYDSEFRYVGRPLASLQGIDANARVIYVGTLSKILFPGIRIGFAVLPADLVDAFLGARVLTDRQPPTHQQMLVAEFMREGHLTGHIRRMRRRYREARDALVDIIVDQAGDLVDVEIPECGIQLPLYFKDGRADTVVAQRAREAGIATRAISPLYRSALPRQGLLLGFSGFELSRLRAAATRLVKIIRSD